MVITICPNNANHYLSRIFFFFAIFFFTIGNDLKRVKSENKIFLKEQKISPEGPTLHFSVIFRIIFSSPVDRKLAETRTNTEKTLFFVLKRESENTHPFPFTSRTTTKYLGSVQLTKTRFINEICSLSLSVSLEAQESNFSLHKMINQNRHYVYGKTL